MIDKEFMFNVIRRHNSPKRENVCRRHSQHTVKSNSSRGYFLIAEKVMPSNKQDNIENVLNNFSKETLMH